MEGKNILFVCAANVNRSITAQFWFSFLKPENQYESAGSCPTACRIHGGKYVTKDQLDQADRIICMDQRNKNELLNLFGETYSEKTECAGIKDRYLFLQLDLIWELVDKVKV